ncbi:hypothetical protein DYB26_006000 [Aphanomyces astaci]|uniref:Uncharacterized protein n=1 Tax=Aphanomyces astaci TaxID=112090 RepID=A0A418FJY1_APHAT|nr:hypothetical protein DYB26_006000 [Aphanomyces astaci]
MRIAHSTKPTHRPRTVGAFEVLTSLDLMLLILDFQGGVYNSHHPLRRLGYYTLATPPLSTDHMQAVDALLSPWLAIFTPSRMLTFLRSTDKYRHSILAAYAAYVGHLPAVRLLIENTTHKCSEASVIDWAAYGGHLHVIQFVHKVSSETARSTINRMYDNNECHLVDGYAPFCKHLFIPNFVGAKLSTAAITDSNRGHLVTQYVARTLVRYFPVEKVHPQVASHLDVILYSRAQIQLENAATGKGDVHDETAPWGIIYVKAQDVDYELPMDPITIMRNALGKEEGGSGVPCDRDAYLRSVHYWAQHAILQ